MAYARGIGTNLNDYTPYEHDGNDIYDAIDWISKQSWCNGKVGMYGGSYTGFAQWAAVTHVHPALKTIVPQVAVMPGYDTPMENNVCASALCRFAWRNLVATIAVFFVPRRTAVSYAASGAGPSTISSQRDNH